ncbi:hypothetical protein D3C77_610410 [compost metagenome]
MHLNLVAVHAQHGAAVQTDDGVTPPFLTALHGFEQVGMWLVGQLEVEGKRGIEISQRLERQRDAVIAVGGQTQEFFAGHVSLVVGGAKQKVGQTGRHSRQEKVRRASANGPGP